MKMLSQLLLLLLGFLLVEAGPAAQEVSLLESGKPIEREISGGQTHSYKLSLAASQYFRVVVTQRGVDVIVVLSAPDSNKIVEVDSPTGKQGNEVVTAIAGSAGEYFLIVRPLDKNTVSGRYEINWVELREATSQDRTRIRAECLLMEAGLLDTRDRDQMEKASSFYERARMIYQELNDRTEEGAVLQKLGILYQFSDLIGKALEYFQLALIRQ